jgi:hypothetical protein
MVVPFGRPAWGGALVIPSNRWGVVPSPLDEDPENMLQDNADPATFPPYRLAAQTAPEGVLPRLSDSCRWWLESFCQQVIL